MINDTEYEDFLTIVNFDKIFVGMDDLRSKTDRILIPVEDTSKIFIPVNGKLEEVKRKDGK